MKSALVVAAIVVAGLAQTAKAQEAWRGEQVFLKCLPCHRVGPDAPNRVGPELNGLDGRLSGSAPGYNYSDANKRSGIVWGEAIFSKYVKNPGGVIPGTKMIFLGLKREKDIADLWAYLKQFGPDGQKK
jgi:cytochrome c